VTDLEPSRGRGGSTRDENFMPADLPLVLEKVKPENEPCELYATGYDTLDLSVIQLPLFTGDDISSDMQVLAMARRDAVGSLSDQLADLVKANPSKFMDINDSGKPYLDYLLDMLAQAWTYVDGVGRLKTFADMSSSGAALVFIMPHIKAGLLGLPFPRFANDWDGSATASDANTLEDQIAGTGWNDTSELGTNCHHWQQLAREAYSWALDLEPNFPKFWSRLEQNGDSVMQRVIWLYVAGFVISYVPFWFVAACQSDRFAFEVAFKQTNSLNRKIDVGLAGPLDPIWEQFARIRKFQYLASALSNQDMFVADWVDTSLVLGPTLEDSIHDYQMTFRVPNYALKKARQMFGVGKATFKGTNENFAILCNLACFTKSGDGGALSISATHGDTTWAVGLNFSCAQFFFRDIKTLESDWLRALSWSKHQTWTDVSAHLLDLFTDFNVMTSINGTAENDAWRGFKALISFSATTNDGWDQGASVVDPNSLLDSSSPKKWKTGFLTGCVWPYFYFGFGWSFPKDRLWNYLSWSEIELQYLMRWGILLSTAESVAALDKGDAKVQERYSVVSLRLVQWMNYRDSTIRGLLKMHGDYEEPRWEKLKDHIGSSYDSINAEYGWFLSHITIDTEELNQVARPVAKTWSGATSMFIGNIGEESVCKSGVLLINGASGNPDKASPIAKPSEAKESIPKGPEGPKSAIGDKESEGL